MKKLFALIAILALCAGTVLAFGKDETNTDFVLVPTMQSKTKQQNRAWVGTFQLVWNDFQDNIVKGPVKFVDDEISECLKKGEHIAKWFATAGKVETIYIELGVRP